MTEPNVLGPCLSWREVDERAKDLLEHLKRMFPMKSTIKAYPVPRGGLHAAQALKGVVQVGLPFVEISEFLGDADIIVDDIIDSGATRDRYISVKPFYALVDKTEEDLPGWVSFPWERAAQEQGPEDNIARIIQFIGDDPMREGLRETPARVVKAYRELFSGYKQKPADIAAMLKTFEDGACDEMVVLKDIEFHSMCEHHMLPFSGKAHIAYLPNRRVLGVSKLARVLDVFARRLQIQERLCSQVADSLMDELEPKGAACVLEAQHFCMVCRGVNKQNSRMVTSALRGAFKDDPSTRSEFMAMVANSSRP